MMKFVPPIGFRRSTLGSPQATDQLLVLIVVCGMGWSAAKTMSTISLDLSESSLCGQINSTNTIFILVHLQKLNLAMNYFNGSHIPSQIVRLKGLRSLNIFDSRFSGQISNEISQLMQLSSLDMSRNPLKLHSPRGLQNLVQNLTRLEELDLSEVDISSSIPYFLANFSTLRSIILQNCLLQNDFPKAIFELPKLKYIDLEGNTNLTGSFPEFNNGSLLEHLNLKSTGFFGIIPESMSNLNHLESLHLYKCYFSGNIPGSLSILTQLTILGLSGNEFTCLVPSLASLSKLTVLGLGGNKFEKGRLPNWLDKLIEVKELYISNMNIESEIPPFLSHLTKLSVVDIGTNSLFVIYHHGFSTLPT